MKPFVKSVADAAGGLNYENALFTGAGPKVGLWTARQQGIVCPRAYESKGQFDTAAKTSAASGWPVHLRPTGGGAVPQGPGVLNLALSFNARDGATIEDVYKLLTQIIKTGLGKAGNGLTPGETPGSFCDGAWNLSCDGRKLVGTAQRWRPVRGGRPRVLAHALILIDDGFQAGTDAVTDLHTGLGLAPVERAAHSSLATALGITDPPLASLYDAARQALDRVHSTS